MSQDIPPNEILLDLMQELSNTTSDAVILGDFSLYRSRFELPLLISTQNTCKTIKNTKTLRSFFSGTRQQLEILNVSDIYRRCIRVNAVEDASFVAVFETRLLANDLFVKRPYQTQARVQLCNGEWKFISLKSGRREGPIIGKALTF